MEDVLNLLQENREFIVVLVSLILALIEIVRERMKARDGLMLLMNSLKVEGKMEGNKFADALLKKVEEVAKVQKVGSDALNEVKSVLNTDRKGIKIGSYNGQPVYLKDVGIIGSTLGALGGAVKGIFKR